MSELTPEQARMYLRAHKDDRAGYLPSYAVEALETLASMTEEWAAIVAFLNPAGQTEEARGHGTTEEEALADARDRQQWLTNPAEYAHATYRRVVTAWERFTTVTTEETSSD